MVCSSGFLSLFLLTVVIFFVGSLFWFCYVIVFVVLCCCFGFVVVVVVVVVCFWAARGGCLRWDDRIRAACGFFTWHLFDKGMEKMVGLETVEVRKIRGENAPNHIGVNLPAASPWAFSVPRFILNCFCGKNAPKKTLGRGLQAFCFLVNVFLRTF